MIINVQHFVFSFFLQFHYKFDAFYTFHLFEIDDAFHDSHMIIFMNKQKKFSASDIDETPNAFLKAMRESFAEVIAAFT